MKDFGDTIPGHGGVTDRFDCQMIMAMFAYLYYWSFVAEPQGSVGEALEVGRDWRYLAAVLMFQTPIALLQPGCNRGA